MMESLDHELTLGNSFLLLSLLYQKIKPQNSYKSWLRWRHHNHNLPVRLQLNSLCQVTSLVSWPCSTNFESLSLSNLNCLDKIQLSSEAFGNPSGGQIGDAIDSGQQKKCVHSSVFVSDSSCQKYFANKSLHFVY
jgi:hypothetical protein